MQRLSIRQLSTTIRSRFLSAFVKSFRLDTFIDSIRHELKPPVANKLISNNIMQLMIVGGPNNRKDFHLEEGEELFIQLQGKVDLDILERGKIRRIPIEEGEVFLLPARVPHSPQRYAESIGLVFERRRRPGEMDGLIWYEY